MKAIVRTRYGPPDVPQFADIEKPTAKDNEVLIKLQAAGCRTLALFASVQSLTFPLPRFRFFPRLHARTEI